MHNEVHNLDSLRKLVRELQVENKQLQELLKKANISYDSNSVFEDIVTDNVEYDPEQGERIIGGFITEQQANRFIGMFWGRIDVYARRASNGNYYTRCSERWNASICQIQRGDKKNCDGCLTPSWIPLTPELVKLHLIDKSEEGKNVIGVYPMLSDSTCRFLVFDFDNHEKGAEKNDFANVDDEWHHEVEALRMICKQNGVEVLVERSRSGKGAHVWIFFQKAIPATTAREFGFLLLDKGSSMINLKSFRYYDRMYPSQDTAKGIGNLIALPLQGGALKKGNSAFVDENWNAYPDQWKHLFQCKKMFQEEIEGLIVKWRRELYERNGVNYYSNKKSRLKPWKRNTEFDKTDVVGKLHIVLADGVYIDTLNLKPRIQNQIRCLATFDNPVYYKNKRLGYYNFDKLSTIYLGEDIEGYIRIPRGLLENILEQCKIAGIDCDIQDEREQGRPLRIEFQGELRMQQQVAVEQMLSYDNGILSAATAFGKTVVCSYLIAKRKVNTLILVERTDLLSQWQDELNKFLVIDEELPKYKTKTGREKTRESIIGTLVGGQDKTTGIVDIAMMGSFYKKGKFHSRIRDYGMVIMDECHHAASATAQEILKQVNAKYVYGVSATPMRSDNLEKINYMLLGPIRHKFSALDRAKEQGIEHLVYPRYTRMMVLDNTKMRINDAYAIISRDKHRNEMIENDVKESVLRGRTPVILTRFKEQAKVLYENLKGHADYIFILYGDNSIKENSDIREQMKQVPKEKTIILVATGQKIGEGFDFPRLDTLMLAAPVSYGGRLEQHVGRLNRDYEGKESVIVYDYIDANIEAFSNSYKKRLRTYKKIGFKVLSNEISEKQNTNAIYDSDNYMEIFERDIVEAEKEIIIASPSIDRRKLQRFLYIVKSRQDAGVKIRIITQSIGSNLYENDTYKNELIQEIQINGIQVIELDDTMCFALIDQNIVWHGGMNLLGKVDVWDNLLRVKDDKIAYELMEIMRSSCAVIDSSI